MKPSLLLIIFLQLFLCSFAFVSSFVSASSIPDLENKSELEAFFDGMLAAQMREYHVPGAVVAMVKDGEMLFTKGYGYADIEDELPVNPETTLFRPGSNSKLFVWNAVMQLVEQGKLDLHEDVNTYLDFKIPDTLADGTKVGPITLAQIMTHTAGFEDIYTELFVLKPEDIRPLGEYLESTMPKRVFPPGQTAAYSNYGTSLAGYIVERVANQPFYIYIEENIFEPLGMQYSTFRQPLLEEFEQYISKGYGYLDGRYVEGGFEYCQSSPAGGLSSSAVDMAKFMISQLQLGEFNGVRILRTDTAKIMQSQQFTYHPQITGMTYGYFESEINNRRILHHGGDTTLFHSGVWLIPAENVGLYIAYNGRDSSMARETVFLEFMDRYFPAGVDQQLLPSAEMAQTAHNYAGIYHFSRNNFTTFESIQRLITQIRVTVDEEGYLVLPLPQSYNTRFIEVETDVFADINGENGFSVLRDSSGKVMEIRLAGFPLTLIRTPWYETLPVIGFVIFANLLLFGATISSWIYKFIKRFRVRGRSYSAENIPKIVAAGFGLGMFLLLLLIGIIFFDTHPVWGVPNTILRASDDLKIVDIISGLLTVLSAGMLISALVAWSKSYWHKWERLHYTVLTLFSFGFLWVLSCVNLLTFSVPMIAVLVGLSIILLLLLLRTDYANNPRGAK